MAPNCWIVYRNLIQLTEPEYTLYLAIDCLVYEYFFQIKSLPAVIKDHRVFLIVVDLAKEELVKWLTNENYRLSIKRILTEYYDIKIHQGQKNADFTFSERLALDEIRDEYLWFRFGWEARKLVQHIIIYLRIKDSKLWG